MPKQNPMTLRLRYRLETTHTLVQATEFVWDSSGDAA